MSDGSGFRLYALDHAQQIRTIRKQLESVRDQRREHLIGGAAQDWADYKGQVGYLEGIDEALRVCDEIEKAERA